LPPAKHEEIQRGGKRVEQEIGDQVPDSPVEDDARGEGFGGKKKGEKEEAEYVEGIENLEQVRNGAGEEGVVAEDDETDEEAFDGIKLMGGQAEMGEGLGFRGRTRWGGLDGERSHT
jgi:hypothetical protein